MVSVNLSFPQTLSSLLRAAASLSGSSWLLHPKFQLDFCCKISSVISSFLPRKAKHKRSGVWHEKLALLTQKRSSEPEFQLLSLKIRAHLSCEMLNPCWEVLLQSWPCCISPGFPRSCRQLAKSVRPRPPLPVVGGRPLEAAPDVSCGKERCSFRSEGSLDPGLPAGSVLSAPTRAPLVVGIFLLNGFSCVL